MLKMEQEAGGRRQRRRPKSRLMDVVREDMQTVGVTEEHAGDRERWRRMYHFDNS